MSHTTKNPKSMSWWPPDLGDPSTRGSTGELRYAYFPTVARLVIDTNSTIAIYDTGSYQFRGTIQQEEGALTCATQYGRVPLSVFGSLSAEATADT